MFLPSWLVISPSLWLQIAIVGAWVGCVGLLAEGLHRYTAAGSETVRKVVHIGVGNVILLAWWLQVPAWLGIGASVFFSAIAFLSYRFPILPSINGVGRKSLGTFFYAVSIGVLMAGFWSHQPHFAVLGVLVMTWGDGMAALIGQRFGQHPYKLWGMEKSWEGSLAMAVVSFVVCGGVLAIAQGTGWQTWTIASFIALAATGLEAFSKYGVDNLTVPIGSALAGLLLSQMLGV